MKLSTRFFWLTLALTLYFTGCAVNPATGKRQLVLVSEAQEIEMGRAYDKQLVGSLGMYPDEDLQTYVQTLGEGLAARSERPELGWQFRVVDDPVVNAFALPGGFIYITRGILAHFADEAQLASVLGHEIGHVTARHSVNQMSKQQLAQLTLGVGTMISPEAAAYGQLAESGLGLLFLKYSRDDERQADDLGLRYLVNGGYDPRPMMSVFSMLESVSATAGGERAPGWMSTHPQPENRKERVRAQIAEMGAKTGTVPSNQGGYYEKIDGIVFGADPRQGYFNGATFLHPEMKFEFQFPEGWNARNERSQVSALSGAKDAQIVVTLSEADTPDAALTEFFKAEGMNRGEAWSKKIGGLPTAASQFTIASEQQSLAGLIAAVKHGDSVFLLVGLTLTDKIGDYAPTFRTALASFGKLTDPDALNVKPERLEVVKIDAAMSLAQFAERYKSAADVGTLALINHVDPDAQLRAGGRYKVVR